MRKAFLIPSLIALVLGAKFCYPDLAIAKSGESGPSKHCKSQADKLYQSGIRKANRGEYQNALLDFTEALKLAPGRADVLIERADAYLHLHRLLESKQDCERAIASAPRWGDAYSYYSRVLDEIGEIARADEIMAKAIKLDPKSEFGLSEGYFYYLLRGRSDQALTCAENLIKSHPRSGQGYILRAHWLNLKKHPIEALADVEKGISLAPNSYLAWITKLSILESLGRYDEALAESYKLWSIRPGYAASAFSIGRLCMLNGDRKSALDWFEKAISLDPCINYTDVVRFLKGRGDTAAIAFADRGLNKFPKDAELHHLRSCILCHSNMAKQAIADADIAASLEPTNAQYATHAGTARYLSGDRAGGKAGFEKGISLAPKFQYLGIVSFLNGQRDPQALSFANRAVAAVPSNADLHAQLAIAQFNDDNATEALREANVSLSIDARNFIAKRIRIESLFALKDYEKALTAISDFNREHGLSDRQLWMRAFISQKKHDFTSAKSDLNVVLMLNPKADIYLLRSAVNCQLGFYDEAVADAQTAMKLDKSCIAEGLRCSYLAHFQKGNLVAASSEFLASLVAVFTPGVKP